jgi:hypothetical protein
MVILIIAFFFFPLNLLWCSIGEVVSSSPAELCGLLSSSTSTSRPTVRVRVSGRSYYMGKNEFTVEAQDPLRAGFLLS